MEERLKGRRGATKRPVPAEGNFEEHPYFRVGDRNAGTGVLRYENELRTKDGNVLQQTWTVRAAHGRGLPGRFDQDVYVVLLQLIDRKGLPEDGWLSFSIYELVELMGRSHSGRDYRQVRESLQRLATTSIESENAFYHRGRKAYITDTFSLLTELRLSEHEGADGEWTDRNRVHLSQYFVDSYRANYLKNLDAPFYWSLSSPVAKRLYRLIDKKRGGRRVWDVGLFSLKQKIPLSDYKYASKIKEKLVPAHAELIDKGFLEKVSYRRGEEGESVTYEIAESFQAKKRHLTLEHPTEDEYFCVQRLKAEGMSGSVAEELVSLYGPGRVMHYIEALPYQKGVRKPAGWLRWAIENGPELDAPPVKPTVGPAGIAGSTGSERSEPGEGTSPEKSSAEKPSPAVGAEGRPGSARLRSVSSPTGPGALQIPLPDPAAQREWDAVLATAGRELDHSFSEIWFAGCVPTSLTETVLTVSVPNPTAVDYIQTRFKAPFEAVLARRLSKPVAIDLIAR